MKKILYHLFALGLMTFFSLFIYSIYEPHTLETTHYTIKNPELAGIKIVFAADFHTAPSHATRLKKIITIINKEQPDIIILGGDYVKGHKKSSSMPITEIAENLAKLQAPAGIYAVLGNHDNWYGKETVTKALQQHNISVLDNENRHLTIKNHQLTLIGISDISTDKPNFVKAFHNATSPAILIMHSPDSFPESPKTSLTLAAHTHGGQVRLPFIGSPIVPSHYKQRYNYGLISENDKTMIVTKGIGTSILPIRFNCHPEIVFITFK